MPDAPILSLQCLCRQHPTLECGCSIGPSMIHTPRCTVYPRCGLVRVDGRLVAVVVRAFGVGYLRRMIEGINRGDAHVSGLYQLGDMLCISVCNAIVASTGNIQPVWWSGEICDWHLLKLQRWWRERLARAREMRLALCMGAHTRLGRSSVLFGLHDDILRAFCAGRASGPTDQCGLCLSCGAPFIARMDSTETVDLDTGYRSILWLNGRARTSLAMQNLFRNPRLVNVPQRAHVFHEAHHYTALDYMMNHRMRDRDLNEPRQNQLFPSNKLPLVYYEDPAGKRPRARLAFWPRPTREDRIEYTELRDFLVSTAREHDMGPRLGHAFPVDVLQTMYDTCVDCNSVMTRKKRFMDLLVRGSTALVDEPSNIQVRDVDTRRHAQQQDGYEHWVMSAREQGDPQTLTPLVAYYLHMCLPFPEVANSNSYFAEVLPGDARTRRITRGLYLQQSWLILEIACLCGTIARSRQEEEKLSCGYKTYLGSLDFYISFFCWRLFQFEFLDGLNPALDFTQWHQKYFTCAGGCRELRLPRQRTVGEWVDPGELQQRELVQKVHDNLMKLYRDKLRPLCRFLAGEDVPRGVSLYFVAPSRLRELVDRSRQFGHHEFDKALARFGVTALTYRMRALCRTYPDDIKAQMGDFVRTWERLEQQNIRQANPYLDARAAGIWHDLAQLVFRPRAMPTTRGELQRALGGPNCSPWASVLTLASMGALQRRRAPSA